MTVAPSPANPELLQAVKDLIYEEIWNEFNPAEQSKPPAPAGAF